MEYLISGNLFSVYCSHPKQQQSNFHDANVYKRKWSPSSRLRSYCMLNVITNKSVTVKYLVIRMLLSAIVITEVIKGRLVLTSSCMPLI